MKILARTLANLAALSLHAMRVYLNAQDDNMAAFHHGQYLAYLEASKMAIRHHKILNP
jgi:hypothetical protein